MVILFQPRITLSKRVNVVPSSCEFQQLAHRMRFHKWVMLISDSVVADMDGPVFLSAFTIPLPLIHQC